MYVCRTHIIKCEMLQRIAINFQKNTVPRNYNHIDNQGKIICLSHSLTIILELFSV